MKTYDDATIIQRQVLTDRKKKTLEQGFTNESRVYLYLKKNGEHSIKEIAEELGEKEITVKLAIQGLRLKKIIDIRPSKYFVI